MKRNFQKSLFVVCVVCVPSVCFPDVVDNERYRSDEMEWESLFESFIESEELSSESVTELYDRLFELRENPIDINCVSKSGLADIPFLDAVQIEDIESYIYLHGRMNSLGELQFINSIDFRTRRLLSLFCYAGEGAGKPAMRPTLHDISKYGRSELVFGCDVPFYKRDGFRYHTPEELGKYPNRRYLGNAFQHNLKYSFNWKDRLKFGFSADKDAGELFTGGKYPVYDYLSGYFQLKDCGVLQNLIVGNMRTSFGCGLVANGGFGMGKSMSLAQFSRQRTALRPHSSVSETGYMTGVGITVGLRSFSLTASASYSARDATLNENGEVTSFKEDGYHRTPLEASKSCNTMETAAAMHAEWLHNGIDIGASVMLTRFSRPVRSMMSLYPSGHDGDWFWSAGLDYSIRRASFSFSGETAVCDNLSMATINTLTFRLASKYDIKLIYRDYSPTYNSIHGSSMSEGDLRNERGLFIGGESRLRGIDISAYTDIFMFPQPISGVSEPSKGLDIQLQLSYAPRRSDHAFLLRYRYKYKEKDSKSLETIAGNRTGRLKLQWIYGFSDAVSLQSQLDFVHNSFPDSGFETGWALVESLALKSYGHFSGSLTIGGFYTDSYSTRVSFYEKGLLYSFNFMSLYGKGLRLSMVLKYTPCSLLSVILKLGSTLYADRDVIGSSQQRIDANHKEDLSLQIRMKF